MKAALKEGRLHSQERGYTASQEGQEGLNCAVYARVLCSYDQWYYHLVVILLVGPISLSKTRSDQKWGTMVTLLQSEEVADRNAVHYVMVRQ